MRAYNPVTGSFWKHGEKNEAGLIFHSYRLKDLDSEGFFKIKWITEEAFKKNKKISRERSQQVRSRNRQIMHSRKLQLGCECCGYRESAVALDFDHRIPCEKVSEVALMGTANRTKLLQEMDKCRILCANCHRIKTYDPQKFDAMLNGVRVLTI